MAVRNEISSEEVVLWLTALLIIVGVIVTILLFLSWSPHHKGRQRKDLPDVARDVLTRMKNGGRYKVIFNRSKFWFSFERLEGNDEKATLALRIPRGYWTDGIIEDIRAQLDSHGFEYRDEPDNKSIHGQVIIPVSNIWESTSGSKGAYAARLLLEAIGIQPDAKFNIELYGDPSKRILTAR